MKRRRRVALTLILIVDLGYIAWGTMAAAFLDRLLGPGGKSILPAGYEGFTRGSWSELVRTAPMTARYFEVLSVNAIGPFEMSEYLGLAMVWAALAMVAPFRAAELAVGPATRVARPAGGG